MGLVHLYCGDGKGKTTAAVGLAVRMCGSGGSVLFAQFIKPGTSSELAALAKLGAVKCVTSPVYHGFYRRQTDAQREETARACRALFGEAATAFASYDLVVLDELVAAYRWGVVDREAVLAAIKARPPRTEIVMTGREPPPELAALADYISCVQKVRHPYDAGVPARSGIEY